MDICVDFDGTCTTHEYPYIGADIGAVPVLKKLIEKGHRIIIFTMRSGEQLKNAYDWYMRNEIPVYGVQANPTQIMWTQSPKAYGQLYIDDAALGCPLSRKDILLDDESMDRFSFSNKEKNGKHYYAPKRDYVDWVKVEKLLIKQGIL